MKKIAFLLCLLISSVAFSQAIQNTASVKKAMHIRHLDSLVDWNEMKGIELYHHAKYDSAFTKFTKAGLYIDTLSGLRKLLSDYENSIVTKCNIAEVYSKRHKGGLGINQMPQVDLKNIQALAPATTNANNKWAELLAITQFTLADCYIEKNLKMTIGNYYAACSNLRTTNAASITYKYSLKAYSYKDSFKEVFNAYVKADDSANMDLSLYYNKLDGISRDK